MNKRKRKRKGGMKRAVGLLEFVHLLEDAGEDAEAGEIAHDAKTPQEVAVTVDPALLAISLGEDEGIDLMLVHGIQWGVGEAKLIDVSHEAGRVGEVILEVSHIRCLGVQFHDEHAIEQLLWCALFPAATSAAAGGVTRLGQRELLSSSLFLAVHLTATCPRKKRLLILGLQFILIIYSMISRPLGWLQGNGNRSNQESKIDFLASPIWLVPSKKIGWL